MIYDYSINLTDGKLLNLDSYKNKVVLIVNIATKCGYTKQLKELQELYSKYDSEGLVVLGVPSNEFFRQTPEDDEAVQSFCELNYGVTFPITIKTRVNTKKAHPLYQYLKEETDVKKIPWNFYKYIIDKKGNIINHYSAKTTPLELESELNAALKA